MQPDLCVIPLLSDPAVIHCSEEDALALDPERSAGEGKGSERPSILQTVQILGHIPDELSREAYGS